MFEDGADGLFRAVEQGGDVIRGVLGGARCQENCEPAVEFAVIVLVLGLAAYLRLAHGRKPFRAAPFLTEFNIDIAAAACTLLIVFLAAGLCGAPIEMPAVQSWLWLPAIMALSTAMFFTSHRMHVEFANAGAHESARVSDFIAAVFAVAASSAILFVSIVFLVHQHR